MTNSYDPNSTGLSWGFASCETTVRWSWNRSGSSTHLLPPCYPPFLSPYYPSFPLPAITKSLRHTNILWSLHLSLSISIPPSWGFVVYLVSISGEPATKHWSPPPSLFLFRSRLCFCWHFSFSFLISLQFLYFLFYFTLARRKTSVWVLHIFLSFVLNCHLFVVFFPSYSSTSYATPPPFPLFLTFIFSFPLSMFFLVAVLFIFLLSSPSWLLSFFSSTLESHVFF